MIGAVYRGVARHPVLAFFVVFASFPWVVPYKSLAAQVLIYGLFALGFNMLYGYTGLLSFGSAAYWGLGAYGTGIALAKLEITSVWLALGIGVGTAGHALPVLRRRFRFPRQGDRSYHRPSAGRVDEDSRARSAGDDAQQLHLGDAVRR